MEQVLLPGMQTQPDPVMNSIDVNRVLSQIRTLQAQAGNRPASAAVAGAPAAEGAAENGFGGLLKNAVDSVAKAQNTAGDLQKKFELGDPNTDLASVMLATSKSQVSFKAMVEVRNRMVSAYQDIMNMPL
jgi:flagellar hook-basal body complex protein FliE